MVPQENECKFEIDELFISRTDKRGIICSGNEVFVRISGYPKTRLLGSPHNIVRHPDMPKSVFRIFWRLIQNNEIAVAYVKNKTADGSYYWVVACVFPTIDGYFSVRLKPSTKTFDTIKDVYSQTVQQETLGGIDGGEKFLIQALLSLGFEKYEDFMRQVLEAELTSKQEILSAATSATDQSLSQLEFTHNHSKSYLTENYIAMMRQTKELATNLQSFQGLKNSLQNFHSKVQKSITDISEACRTLDVLSINMALAAHKLGRLGLSLSIVSGRFKKTASEVNNHFGTITPLADSLHVKLQRFMYLFNSSDLLNQMLIQYFGELTHQATSSSTAAIPDLPLVQQDTIQTIDVAIQNNISAVKVADEAINEVTSLKLYVKRLEFTLKSLDIIRMSGRLESAIDDSAALAFSPYVDEMNRFVDVVTKSTHELLETIAGAENALRAADNLLRISASTLLNIDLLRNRISCTTESPKMEAAS